LTAKTAVHARPTYEIGGTEFNNMIRGKASDISQIG
jgi:hypothetical protein